MRTPLLLGVILASVPLQNLAGQEISEIALGERIRVSAPECDLPKKEGSFRGVEGGSLVLRMGSNESICPLSAVNRLEIHQGRRHWGKNTAVGALIGGLGGAAIGASTGGTGAVVGAVAGVPLGAAIGTGPYARKAALLGLGIGVAGGALTGAVLGADDWEYGRAFWVIVFGIVGAPVGAFTGSAIGLLRGEDQWVAAASPGLMPQLVVTPDGRIGFGLSIPVGR